MFNQVNLKISLALLGNSWMGQHPISNKALDTFREWLQNGRFYKKKWHKEVVNIKVVVIGHLLLGARLNNYLQIISVQVCRMEDLSFRCFIWC